VQTPDGKSGYVKADALQQTKTKGVFVPIIIAAAAPVAKVVITKAIGWFKKLFGISDQKADQLLGVGQELLVLAQESGMLKVQLPIGAKDILRVEANTYAPYHYVPSTDGCAPTMTFKGGSFSVAGEVKNPTAQIMVEYEVLTNNNNN